MTAAPRWATPRSPNRATIGTRIGQVARLLGKTPMPWQQQVYDVAGELDADGNLVHEIVVVTVPRQSGKTTLVGPVQIDRAMHNPASRIFYTAQSGKDARKRFEDLANLMNDSPLRNFVKFRWSAGDMGCTFHNRASINVFAPTLDAIHGETPPLVTFDEFWAYDELLGDALLEGAVIPAQMTLAGRRQIWLISTAGTAASTFMRKWVERGRRAVETHGTASPEWSNVAYFEWSMPDGADPYDPDVIASFHPAVGYTVTVEELLAISQTVSHSEWMRAFCNVWLEASNPLFSTEHWNQLNQEPDGIPSRRDLAVTYEVAPDDACGIVVASWRDDSGKPCSRVLHSAPGSLWMHDYIARIHRDWKPAVLGADDGGPTRRITDQLRRTLGDDAITTTGGRDFGTACDSWLTLVRDKELRHDGSRSFATAVAHLVLSQVGDVTRFSRKASTGPIVAAVASAVGIWLYDHRQAPLPRPRISGMRTK